MKRVSEHPDISLTDIIVLISGDIISAPIVTMISARLKRVQEHSSAVMFVAERVSGCEWVYLGATTRQGLQQFLLHAWQGDVGPRASLVFLRDDR